MYDRGREGDILAAESNPRKACLSIYIMPGYQSYSVILAGLGKHKLEKSCLFVIKLADINMDVLAKRIRAELHDLDRIKGVHSEW